MAKRKPSEDLTTKERILSAAAAAFLHHGYGNTPLSAIAQEVGVTKAALYYHFPSKDQILVALVGPLLDRIDALLEGTPKHFSDNDARWQFILDYADILRGDPRAVAILGADNQMWLRPELLGQIIHHRDRTVELATPADADEQSQVRALLAMDMIHRELVFTVDRLMLPGVAADRRQQLVMQVAREVLEGASVPRP